MRKLQICDMNARVFLSGKSPVLLAVMLISCVFNIFFLVQRRYDMSPRLHMKVSYKTICKALYTAVAVAHLKADIMYLLYRGPRAFKDFSFLNLCTVKRSLASLPVLTRIMQTGSDTMQLNYLLDLPGFNISSLVAESQALITFPNLSEEDLRRRYTGEIFDNGNTRSYALSSLQEMEVARYGSVEAYQAVLLEEMLGSTPELEKYLVYHYRSEKWSQVADYLRDRKVKFEVEVLLDSIGETWFGSVMTQVVRKIRKHHSAVESYLENRLFMSIEDYFGACAEYHRQQHKKMNRFQWLRHQKALFPGFGSYIAIRYPDHNVWTREELLDTMTEYGNTLDP